MTEPATTVQTYLSSLPPEVRRVLEEVRTKVLETVPEGEERISYGMPAVFCHGVVVYYAAFRKHIGVYPPVSDPSVKAKVAAYAGPKGNLQFPLRDPMPLELIAEVAKARLAENLMRLETNSKGRRTSRAPKGEASQETPSK